MERKQLSEGHSLSETPEDLSGHLHMPYTSAHISRLSIDRTEVKYYSFPTVDCIPAALHRVAYVH